MPCASELHGRRSWDMSESHEPILHVALVGHTGVGKSTLVNVLKGDEIAAVNNDARPCTTQTTPYDVVRGDARYRIWDTRGLNEASEKTPLLTRALRLLGMLPGAEREVRRFLRGKNPCVDLVLFCIDASKIKVKVQWKIYNKIHVDFCARGLKVAVVVMRLGEGDIEGSEWKRMCRLTATGVVDDFPDGRLMEAVPKFQDLSDQCVRDCRERILKLVSNACRGHLSRGVTGM